jgi:hypothetical protein
MVLSKDRHAYYELSCCTQIVVTGLASLPLGGKPREKPCAALLFSKLVNYDGGIISPTGHLPGATPDRKVYGD